MSYQDTALWRATLGTRDSDDPTGEERAKLRSAFLEFRENVKPLGQEVALSVPGYTDHSIEHCDSLWDTADLIIGPEYPLTATEAFVLGGAFLIHDLAMGLAAYAGGLPEIISSRPWKDLLWAEWGANAEKLQFTLERDVEANPTWDGISSSAVKSTLTTFLREHHAQEAENMLKKEWHLSSGEPFYLLSSPELRHWYGEVIGKIARSHWLDVQDLEAYLPAPFGAPASLPSAWTVDPLKVACILRLADASQIDSRRAHPLQTPFRQPQGESRAHWEFQERMLLPHEKQGRIIFTSSQSFDASKAEAWWLAYDTVQMINNELQRVDSLCADLGRPRMLCKSAAGADAPERFAQYVPTSGWNPIDARPRIRNPIRVIESLGGRALYGNEDDVPIRELLANATDAATARVAAQGGDVAVPPTQIEFFKEGRAYYLRIRDYGIGMSADDITYNLCDFGSSGWRSARFRSEYPGALSNGYSSTGKFGIGFFSAFMIADEVRVVTRALQAAWDQTYCLEFKGGIAHRPVLRRADRTEQLAEPGTEITLRLRMDPHKRGGLLFGEGPLGEADQVLFIRNLAFTCRHPIDVKPLGATSWLTAVDRQPWYEKSAEQIYEATHWTRYSRTPPDMREAGIEYFADSLAPLQGAQGEIVGMLCTTAVRVGPARSLAAAAAYCGGFQSGRISGISGVVEGETVRASRDRITVQTTLAKMQDWITGQWNRNLPPVRRVSELDLLRLHAFSLGFGIERPDAPVCMTADGFLSLEQLDQWIAGRREFYLVDAKIPGVINLGELGNWIPEADDLMQPGTNTLLVGYDLRDPDDGLPDAEFDDPFESDWDGDWSDEIDDKASEWWMEHNSPVGAVARAACRAWNVDLRELLLRSDSAIGELRGEPTDPVKMYGRRPFHYSWRTFRRVR